MSMQEAQEAAVVGAASAVGFWLGAPNPILAPVLGGVFGGVASASFAWDGTWGDVAQAFAGGFMGGLIGGAVGGLGLTFLRNYGWSLAGVGARPTVELIRGLRGPLGAGLGSSFGSWVTNNGSQPGPTPGPQILPTKYINPGFPLLMPPVKMPDQDNEEYKQHFSAYFYAKSLQDYYEGTSADGGQALPQTLVAFWQSFGDPKRVEPVPPETIGIPKVDAIDEVQTGMTLSEYQVAVQRLGQIFARFQDAHQRVAEVVNNSAKVSFNGQQTIRQLIEGGEDSINRKAPVIPHNMNETAWIVSYLGAATSKGEQALRQAHNEQSRNAAQIAAVEREVADLRQRVQQFGTTQRDTDRERVNTTNAAIKRDLTEFMKRLKEQEADRNRSTTGDPEIQGLARGVERVEKALADAEARNRGLAQNGSATQNAAADPLSQMLQQLALQSRLGGLGAGFNGGLGGGFDPRLERQRDALEREQLRWERRQAELERNRNVAPPPPPRPPVAVAASPPPPRLDPSVPLNAQPAKDDSESKGAPAGRTPDEDGKVLYTFADGRQQRVWPVVADALDVALANNAGTDAQAAYGGTSAKWTDDKEIGDRVDPNQLMTGDVCAFENTEAIAVVWGSPDSGGTLELVVNGELVPFDPESKVFEALGPFVGFRHPPIDVGATDGGVAVASANTENQAVPVPG